jgi:hypothetical protein
MGWGETLQRVAANQYYDLQGDTMTFVNNNGVMHLTLPIPGEVYFSGDRLQPLHLSAAELRTPNKTLVSPLESIRVQGIALGLAREGETQGRTRSLGEHREDS